MRKKLCPQCRIASMYVKDAAGSILPVYVMQDSTVVPKYEVSNLEQYDLTVVYCLGCSWSGSPEKLLKVSSY